MTQFLSHHQSIMRNSKKEPELETIVSTACFNIRKHPEYNEQQTFDVYSLIKHVSLWH